MTLGFTYHYHFLWLVIIQEFVHNILYNHRLIENASKSIYTDVSLPSLGVQTCLICKEQVSHSHHSSVSLMQLSGSVLQLSFRFLQVWFHSREIDCTSLECFAESSQ